MSHTRTTIQIGTVSGATFTLKAIVKNPYPINRKGDILRYSKELSDYGECKFRVSTKDPLLSSDILQPHVYHVRIKRGTETVWSGAIVDNTERNKNYIEVVAVEYDYYLDKMLIRRDASVTAGDGKENYRTFNSGTMAAAVTSVVNSAKTDFGSTHPLAGMTVSSANIENPNYPQGFKNADGTNLTGAWNFSSFITLQFDYHSAFYVLKAFGLYANCDFEVDEDLVFSFKKFIGNKNSGMTFEYGTRGNIVDYNTPRLGRRMANDMWGIAADTSGKVLHVNQRDSISVNTYGILQKADAFADVKDANFLKTRVNESLQFLKTPDDSPINIILDEKSYPQGQWGLGDIVTVKIKDNIIDYNKPRRIVGVTVTLHNLGKEVITIQTNRPRDMDMQGA